MTVSVDRFLSGVKRRITMPSNQVLLKDDAILEMADDCLRDQIVPLILSANQNYFVAVETEQTVDGIGAYDIPERSMGRGLRDLKLQTSGDPGSVRDLSLYSLEDAHTFAQSGSPSGFYFFGDQIVVVPAPNSAAYTLIKYYNRQVSALKPTTNAAMVVSVSGDQVICSTAGSGLSTGAVVDFVKGSGAGRVLTADVTISSLTGVTFDFPVDSVPDGLVAGDYIALAKTTPVLQIPDEVHPLLEALTCERCLESIGDVEGAQKIGSKVPEYTRNAAKILSPRVEGEATKIINRNGLLRGRRPSFWRTRGGLF